MSTESISTERESTTTEKSELSVALLVEDIELARDLSALFRQAKVMPYVYHDLTHYWDDVFGEIPSLSLIDVGLMTKGELKLKDHPRLKEMQVAFIYHQEDAPLLLSTQFIDHLGLINASISLKGQIQAVLRHFNTLNRFGREKRELQRENARLESQTQGLITHTQELKQKDYYHRLTDVLIDRFEDAVRDQHSGTRDFEEVLDRVLGHVYEVEKFSLVELSRNAQRLVAPSVVFTSTKYVQFPALWPGQTLKEGIAPFAQSMAQQVAAELMGGELMCLALSFNSLHPNMLLFLSARDEEWLNGIQWDRLEKYLSGLWARIYLEKRNFQNDLADEAELDMWSLFSLLDHVFYDHKSLHLSSGETIAGETDREDYALFAIDCSKIAELISRKKGQARFYWADFKKDFIQRFNYHCKTNYRVSSWGVDQIFILTSKNHEERLFTQLKSFCARYPLWRFFADAQGVLTEDLRPEVSMVPLSSIALWQKISKQQRKQELAGPLKDQIEDQMEEASQSELRRDSLEKTMLPRNSSPTLSL